MNLNLFGDDDDVQSSGFSANLKLETYNSVVIAFDSVTSDSGSQDKEGNPDGKDKQGSQGKEGKDKDKQDKQDKQGTAQLIHILNQKMIVEPNASALPVDLDEEEKNTQSKSCDYLVYVPTSFDVAKEKVDAFYETEYQFKKMAGKLNMKDAAATVFMQWNMFQKFVKYANQYKHKRALQWIQQSFQDANASKQTVVNDMKNVRDLHDLTAVNNTVNLDEKGDELFVILYTTPVSTDQPVTIVNSLTYLPFANEFIVLDGFGNPTPVATHKYRSSVSQKVMTYYYNYFTWLYAKTVGSFGRITNYVPPMNSRMVATTVTQINLSVPSYNIENINYFLRTLVRNSGLPNRNVLRNNNKMKIIQDKTRLYTFKSTPDYNLNYEKLLERLYYKYPCHLTPSVTITKEAKDAITAAAVDIGVVPAGMNYDNFIGRAIGASDKTKSHSIVCAMAIATREFIYYHAENDGANTDADAILTHLFTNINFGGGVNAVLKPQIQVHLNAYATATVPIVAGQLNPLIGAACAAGDAVYAAAKLAITTYVKDNAATTNRPDSKVPALAAIKKAMDSVIDNFDNFAAFAYDNDTMLSLLKYSDKAQAVDNASATAIPMTINAANLMEKADYLKTLYKKSATKEEKSEAQQQKDEFDTVHDDELYVICGPVYFDYTWIFKQNPELIQHILGEMSETDLKELKEGWSPVQDPLTENEYHINRNPEERSYPKMRFDNPTKMPAETSKANNNNTGSSTYSWKEQYVSPSQATDEKMVGYLTNQTTSATAFATSANTYNIANGSAYAGVAEYYDQQTRANLFFTGGPPPQLLNSIYNWKTPGYYQYECTQKIARRTGTRKWENKHIQLMRPPTYENGVQDFTEPNLPTAYPPPLMSIVPPFRGPANTFVIHAWIPGETFIAEDGTLNQRGCMDYMYKMMQLIFKTAEKNASEIALKKRTCIKISAIGYESQDMKSLKKITRPEDRQFIGDAFFSAVRDYSMLYETTIRVMLYYDTTTQSGVKTRYDDYVNQRLSVLRKSDPLAMDTSLHLKIANMDDFFTLKWYPVLDQLSKNDLLYFVDYCSSPRAFIGNMGEWPENIEEVMDDAIKPPLPPPPPHSRPLLACLSNAFASINTLYVARGIKEKMTEITGNIVVWARLNANVSVNGPTGFNTIINNLNNLCADSGTDAANQVGSGSATNLMVSWWKNDKTGGNPGIMTLPRNAYISSFDEHVMILHNLLSNSNNVDSAGAAAGWANNAPFFDNPDNVNAIANSRNTTVNYGPYVVNSFARNRNNTFENAVYAYTQAKKILTLLSKMKYDEIQITKADNDKIKAALAALNAYNVGNAKMSWSMDAKFTAAVAEGAFIPNSSALHNPFMCPALLDPKEWQFMDFDDVGVREIAGADPVTSTLKPFIDAKIKRDTSAVATGRALLISKQPNVDRLKKNVGVILENMFHRNEPIRYDGKNAVVNNYAWNNKLFYKKRNEKVALQQLTDATKSPDFARLMGLRPSGKCINFPLFAIHLTMYLHAGKLSDMTGMDVARLSCSLDGNMFKTNAQIIWDQMMKNLKEKEKNFTVAQVLGRLGRPTTTEDYEYTAKWDITPPGGNATATALINAVTAAKNPTLKTTNVETLKKIQAEVTRMNLLNSPLYNDRTHGIVALVRAANDYNTAELGAVNAANATLGWNAATQRESTVLYMNKMAKKNGTMVNIASELTSLKPGDKIYIKDETNTQVTQVKKRQVWRVTGTPKSNTTHNTIIDIPVTYAARPFNVTSVLRDIDGDANLTVALERFVQDEELD
jgi:hypothetical protein